MLYSFENDNSNCTLLLMACVVLVLVLVLVIKFILFGAKIAFKYMRTTCKEHGIYTSSIYSFV